MGDLLAMPVKIFCCYAREDEQLLKMLKKHLMPLQRTGFIRFWHDRDIGAGAEWEYEINEHLNAAHIILLLISPDFMASEYCYGIEMKRAMERHERKETHVIPIILRPVYWEGSLGKLQALPKDAKPIASSNWHYVDEALFDVAEGIRKIAERIASDIQNTERHGTATPEQHLATNVGMPEIVVGSNAFTAIRANSQLDDKGSVSERAINTKSTFTVPPSDALPSSYSSRQATIHELLRQLVDADARLERDTCDQTIVRFGVKSWDIPVLKAGKKWPPSGRILLFTIEDKRQSLDFQLGLGWSSKGTDIREKLFRMALSHEPPFLPIHFQQLPAKWIHLYRRKMLSPQAYTELDDSELEAEIRKEWTYFAGQVLPQLDAVLKRQEWFG